MCVEHEISDLDNEEIEETQSVQNRDSDEDNDTISTINEEHSVDSQDESQPVQVHQSDEDSDMMVVIDSDDEANIAALHNDESEVLHEQTTTPPPREVTDEETLDVPLRRSKRNLSHPDYKE